MSDYAASGQTAGDTPTGGRSDGDSAPVPARVSRKAERVRDGIALAVLAGGVGLYAYAHRGMQALTANQVIVGPGESLVARWDQYRMLSNYGLLVCAAGIAVGVWSYLTRGRDAAPTPRGPAPAVE